MWVYIVQFVAVILLSVFLIFYYTEKDAACYARFLVFFSLVVSFSCFMILPIDIYESSFGESNAQSIQICQKIWIIIYYINFFMCWIILPFAQQYEDSGKFSIKDRLKEALLMNGIIIGVLCVVAILFVLYLVISSKFTIQQLPGVFATIVNLFGLTLVSILLGYGLISFPKEFYLQRDQKKLVSRCHRMAEGIKAEQQTIMEEIHDIKNCLEKDEGRDVAEKRILFTLIDQHFKFDNQFRHYGDQNVEIPKKQNSDLHKIIKKRILEYNCCENQLDELVDDLRDITECYLKNNYSHKKIYFTILFVLATTVSALIFLAQLSTFIPFLSKINILSAFAWNEQVSFVINLIMTVYIAYIVAHTIFRIKIYKTFALHKRHSTASSFIFTAINLSRVCYPLCYNYLQITNMPSASFLDFFGQVNLTKEAAIIFPIIMLVFALFNIFDVYDTIMGYLGLGSYAFDEQEEQQKRDEGKKILIERFHERNIQSHRMEMMQLL